MSVTTDKSQVADRTVKVLQRPSRKHSDLLFLRLYTTYFSGRIRLRIGLPISHLNINFLSGFVDRNLDGIKSITQYGAFMHACLNVSRHGLHFVYVEKCTFETPTSLHLGC